MQDLMREMQQNRRLLDKAINAYKERGSDYAQKKRDYGVALAAKILALRADGFPVTIIGDVARGDERVAQLRLDRDAAEVVYESAREAIHAYKLNIRILESQIAREWGHASEM